MENKLATKDDLRIIEAGIREVKTELKYQRWLLSAIGISVLLNIVLNLI